MYEVRVNLTLCLVTIYIYIYIYIHIYIYVWCCRQLAHAQNTPAIGVLTHLVPKKMCSECLGCIYTLDTVSYIHKYICFLLPKV